MPKKKTRKTTSKKRKPAKRKTRKATSKKRKPARRKTRKATSKKRKPARKTAKKRKPARKTAKKRKPARRKTRKTKKTKTKRKPNKAFMAPMLPSPDLAQIVGSKAIPRTQVVKKLWQYIKRRKLQDPKNRRNIRADERLLKVFKGKKVVSMFDMTKLVNKQLRKAA